jgi:hypothetical protein
MIHELGRAVDGVLEARLERVKVDVRAGGDAREAADDLCDRLDAGLQGNYRSG